MKQVISPPIEYLKSALSISTVIGCPLRCEYCVIGEIIEEMSPKKVTTPEKLIENLRNYRFFISNVTPLVINNKTDPLFGQTKSDTFEILRLLNKKGLSNPRIIISKLPLLENDLKFLEKLNSPVYFITSYSQLPLSIEKNGFKNQQISLQTLKNRKKVKSLHYWRPLIRGINDHVESILEVLNQVRNSCDASIVSGLRITSGIKERMERFGAKLNDWDGDRDHKFLPLDIFEKILQEKDKHFPGYLIIRHTSCAISLFDNKSDFGFNYLKGYPHCLENCPNKPICKLRKTPQEKEVKRLVKQAIIDTPFTIYDSFISFEGQISQQERSFLLHSLGFPIKARIITKSLSEERLIESERTR